MKIRRLVAMAAVALAALGVAGPAAAAGSYPPVPPPAAGSFAPGLLVAAQKAQVQFNVAPNASATGKARAGDVLGLLFNGVPGQQVYLTVKNGGLSRLYTLPVDNGSVQVGPLQAVTPGQYVFQLTNKLEVTSGRGTAVHAAAADYSATFTLTVVNGVGAGGTTTNAGSSANGLPKTGGSGLTPVWVGLALLLTGGAFVGVTTRRAKRSS